MSDLRHFRSERDGRGVATITLDVADSPVNVFNAEVMDELARLIARLEAEPPRLALVRSGKASGFLAGADIHHLRRLRTADEVESVLAGGQELFARWERLPFPTIAVIHGPCLGGGLEFALAFRYRLARDDAATRIGLPEVQLGLIPGWGGTQRLPRLVGIRQALRMILEGTAVTAAHAVRIGLLDAAYDPTTFEADVERFVTARLEGRSVRHPTRGLADTFLEGTWPGRKALFSFARRRIAARAEQYPALAAALRAIEAGVSGPRDAGYAVERAEFKRVVFTPAARNLIGIFVGREKARKRSTWIAESVRPRPITRVAVVGGGVMGAGIAQLLALNGLSVVVKEVNEELAAAAAKRIESLTRQAVAKGGLSAAQAETVRRAVVTTANRELLAGCELAVEAVVERADVKRAVFGELATILGPSAVLATNTSALSVTALAEGLDRPERVAGLHFFNPVHKMPLVEVVRGRATDDATIATLLELVRKLGKVPVVVADSPGFLVNRILFPYLDEAVRLVLEGVSAEEVDRSATHFGMPVGPLELLDQVGIDVAADVARTFAVLTPDPGPVPDRFREMVGAGALGQKAGHGFYAYRHGKRVRPTQWAEPGRGSRLKPQPSSAATESKAWSQPLVERDRGLRLSPLTRRLIYPMVNEAARCLESGVVTEPWVIDLAMVLGTGFAPFLGGPLRLADAIGLDRVVGDLTELSHHLGPRFEPCPLLKSWQAEGRRVYSPAEAATASL